MRMIPLFIILFMVGSCTNDKATDVPEPEAILTFVAAGHTYGNPDTYTESLYPPFLDTLIDFQKNHRIDYLFLTGDVVAHPTPKNWDTVVAELTRLNIPFYIARGNHDAGAYMEENVQADKFLSLNHANNLFLVLNTSYSGWSVDSLQAAFIASEIEKSKQVENIFVFSHQLWWLKNRPDSMSLDSIRPNSFALVDGDIDFWQTGFPPFQKEKKPVYFIAGDLGCYFGLVGYYEDHFENFHFYGSGMGGAVEDNFLYVEVFEKGDVKITRVDF